MQNSVYWQKRLEKLTNSLMLGQERDTVAFLRAYKSSLTDIQTYVNQLYSKYSKDGVLTLNEMYKLNRYTNMENEIASIISSLGNKEKTYMKSELTKIYEKSYISTGKILVEGIPTIAISFNKIPTGFVNKALTYPWSGLDYSSRIWKNKEVLTSNLKQTLTRGFIQGSSISDMTKELKATLDNSATNCRRLVRTESQHIMASSHHDVYKKANVTRVKFITANDPRECDECRALNGKIFDIDEAPMTPLHPNGRCVVIPYFED